MPRVLTLYKDSHLPGGVVRELSYTHLSHFGDTLNTRCDSQEQEHDVSLGFMMSATTETLPANILIIFSF